MSFNAAPSSDATGQSANQSRQSRQRVQKDAKPANTQYVL